MGEESPPPLAHDVIPGDMQDLLKEPDCEGDLPPEFQIKEELVEEVMRELYREITCSSPPPPTTTCRSPNMPSPPENIPSPSPVFPARVVFVEDGKSESCGASVSDSSSSVMAGMEYVGVSGKIAGQNINSELSGNGKWLDGMIDGSDGEAFDDEWLEMVTGWVPVLELEGWT